MDSIKKAQERDVRFGRLALGPGPFSFLPPVGFGLLSLLKQFIGQRSRRATLDLFNDRGRGSVVYVYPRLPR